MSRSAAPAVTTPAPTTSPVAQTAVEPPALMGTPAAVAAGRQTCAQFPGASSPPSRSTRANWSPEVAAEVAAPTAQERPAAPRTARAASSGTGAPTRVPVSPADTSRPGVGPALRLRAAPPEPRLLTAAL